MLIDSVYEGKKGSKVALSVEMFISGTKTKKWKPFYFILNGSNRELCYFQNEKVIFKSFVRLCLTDVMW